MKIFNSLLSLILLSSMSIASAESQIPAKKQILAQYNFGQVVDTSDGTTALGEFVLKRLQVSLRSDRSIKIVESSFNSNNRWHASSDNQIGEEVVVNKKLSQKAFELLRQDVIALSDAEIKKTTAQIVCMMMPSWEQSQDHLSVAREYDYEQNLFKGELQLVDGPHGCWLRSHVHPALEHEHATAKTLKRSLKLLAL